MIRDRAARRRILPGMTIAGAVIYVSDLDRMQRFYADCLGWTDVDHGEGYRGMASSAGLVTLVRSPDATPSAWPAPRRSETAIKLTVEVDSLVAARHRITAAGGTVEPASTQWSFRGATHCDAVDPEGNVIGLIERAPETPEP